MGNIEQKIEQLQDQANEKWESGKFAEAIQLLKKGWSLLPDPKEEHPESYHLAHGIIINSLSLDDTKNAIRWTEILFNCDPDRDDLDIKHLIAGKVYYQAKDMGKAKQQFNLANKLSGGRCFDGEERKYIELLDQPFENTKSVDELIESATTAIDAGSFSEALHFIYDALNLEEALDRPIIYMLKGICHYELNDSSSAADALTRAYMLGENDIFEHFDTKYFNFLTKKIGLG